MPTQQQQPTSTPNHRASCHRGRWVQSTIGYAAAFGVALVVGAPTAVASPSPEAVKAIHDRYVDFGSRNGMFVVGHTLVWHSQTPRWVFQDAAGNQVSRDTLLARMRAVYARVSDQLQGEIRRTA